VKIIEEGRGTQFDPVITDALVEIQDKFKNIAQQYS
jgi:HD-GYP domain-containing protein (c-di-GMP phosphodiesterase class II)